MDWPRKKGLTIDPYTTSPAKMKKPLIKRLVASGSPLMVLNSLILVVIIVKLLIPT